MRLSRPQRSETPESPPQKSIRVGLIGSARFYRESLFSSLCHDRRLAVVDLDGNYDNPVKRITRLRPQVVLLDLPLRLAADAIREIVEASPSTRVIALGPGEEDEDILRLLELGLAGFVPRNASLGDLGDAIVDAARGDLKLPPGIIVALLARLRLLACRNPSVGTKPLLTVREMEILRLLEQSLTNKEIAGRLGIGSGTVKGHVHHLLEKLGIRRRSEVAQRIETTAHSLGLIEGEAGAANAGYVSKPMDGMA